MQTRKYQKSLRRERELIRDYRRNGKMVSRLDRRDGFDLMVVDFLEQTVTLVKVAAHKGSTFRVDRDIAVRPGWNLKTQRITYDGLVDK